MKLLSLEQKKKISNNILIDVAKFCEDNNISYFLTCGTLLGAIKYQGFIPWDDDVDVMMPRPDYEKFIEIYNGQYKILKPSDGMYYYAKVYDQNTVKIEKGIDYKKYKPTGIDIDIFPLDGTINDSKYVLKTMRKIKICELFLRLSNQPIFYRKNPLKSINRIIPRIIGSKNIVRIIESIAKKYKYEDVDYVIRLRNTPNGATGAMKKEVYSPVKYMKFENNVYRVPNNYDYWLKTFYGENYMSVEPPIDKRRPHHVNECYMKEDYHV